MKVVYLVRHAQANFENRDDMSRELSQNGLKDRNKITDYFVNISIDEIYSSPYKRAIDTIKPCSKNKNLIINLVDDFRERVVGEWVDDFDEFAQKQWNDFSYKIDGGENLSEVQVRNINALTEIIKNKDTIIISGHGTSISTILNFYDSKFTYANFKKLKMPSIAKLDFDDNLKLIGYNLIDIF